MLLYIDPGTGSMLFSILIGAAATLFFLAKAVFIKLKVVLSGGKSTAEDKAYKKYVIYCEDKRYWNVFKPILDEAEKRKIEVWYFVATDKDPVFNESYQYIKTEVIGEGNKAFAKLNMLSAGFVLMTTPGLGVYQLKRSRNVKHYSHIEHSTGDATMYRLFGLDYFDSVLVTGMYKEKDVRYLEEQRNISKKEIVSVGCTYLDIYKEEMEKIPAEDNHVFTVLLSPSWGKSAILSKYGTKLLDPLLETGWNIIVRPHPQSKISEKEMLDFLTEKYKDRKNLIWDYEGKNIYSMKKADIMISDFSGIIYDYTFLCDKPVMYVNAEMDLMPYDAYDVPGQKPWQVNAVKEFGIELKEEQFANIKDVIQNASDSKELAELRAKAKNMAWEHIGEAGKLTVDYMISKVQ